MAAGTVIGFASTSSSSSFSIRLTNCSTDHRPVTAASSISTNRFISIQNPVKTLNLKAQPFLCSTPFSILSRSTLSCSSFAYGAPGSVSSNKWTTDSEDEEEENGVGRLYVGSLPYSISSSALGQIFGEAGRVTSVEIICDRETDKSRGFGFVTMASVQEAEEAIRLFDGSKIEGRKVKVNFPEVPWGGERETMKPKIESSKRDFIDSPHKLYAGNLSWDITSEELKDAFRDLSGILSAKVIYDRDTGRSRGFGFISFESAEELQIAIETMNGVELEGRPVRLNTAEVRA